MKKPRVYTVPIVEKQAHDELQKKADKLAKDSQLRTYDGLVRDDLIEVVREMLVNDTAMNWGATDSRMSYYNLLRKCMGEK